MISRRNALLTGLGLAPLARAAQPHPLYFVPNRGQFESEAVFACDQRRWKAVFGARRIGVEMKRLVGDGGPAYASTAPLVNLDLRLLDAACPAPLGEDRREGRSDYYFRGDPKTFIENVPHFYRLRYADAWPGVDVLLRGWEGTIELSLAVRAGADLSAVRLEWASGTPRVLGDGSVLVDAPWGVFRQTPAAAGRRWRLDGERRAVLA